MNSVHLLCLNGSISFPGTEQNHAARFLCGVFSRTEAKFENTPATLKETTVQLEKYSRTEALDALVTHSQRYEETKRFFVRMR
jgi:hypothetical protein